MGTEREFVCPFVAYDEDRDFRSSVPDHRHRCFAESPAASRALAHQAAYCLSSAFAGCPTFIDWARREAAPPKDEPIRTLREAPTAPRDADRAAPAAGRPTAPQAAPATSGRQRRAEWTAPPPWAPDAGAVVRAGEADPGDEPVGRPDPRSTRDEAPDALRRGHPGDLGERDLHLVRRLGAALVDPRRLAGRPDEHAGEHVGQRRMPLPIQHEAFQQIWPAQKRRGRVQRAGGRWRTRTRRGSARRKMRLNGWRESASSAASSAKPPSPSRPTKRPARSYAG